MNTGRALKSKSGGRFEIDPQRVALDVIRVTMKLTPLQERVDGRFRLDTLEMDQHQRHGRKQPLSLYQSPERAGYLRPSYGGSWKWTDDGERVAWIRDDWARLSVADESAPGQSSVNEKTPAGTPGFSRMDDRHWGDPIAANNKQHWAPPVHTQLSDFHNLSDQAAAIGSIKLGSLFLTLPTRVLTGKQIMPLRRVGGQQWP